MNELTCEKFIENLIKEVPALMPLYCQHIVDNDELLPHVFFGDVTRYAINEYEQYLSHKSKLDNLFKLIDFLEMAMKLDNKKIQELISVSFLENLDKNNKYYLGFKSLLGKSLKKELTNYEN